jgi:hypothetical protein
LLPRGLGTSFFLATAWSFFVALRVRGLLLLIHCVVAFCFAVAAGG